MEVIPKEALSVGEEVILDSCADSKPALGELKLNTTVLPVLALESMEILEAGMFSLAAIVATICSLVVPACMVTVKICAGGCVGGADVGMGVRGIVVTVEPGIVEDAGVAVAVAVPVDAGVEDAGVTVAVPVDIGGEEAGVAVTVDTGVREAGVTVEVDAGVEDAGVTVGVEAGVGDAGVGVGVGVDWGVGVPVGIGVGFCAGARS